MKKHILLDKAQAYKFSEEITAPRGCTYDRAAGLWRNQDTGKVMMTSNHPEKMETKKCDIETGEDQKGE